jgi:hypothetical protein
MKDTIKKFLPQDFNDFLCLFVLGAIFTLWLLEGFKLVQIDREVIGATIAFFTIIGQFYYRKSQTEKDK